MSRFQDENEINFAQRAINVANDFLKSISLGQRITFIDEINTKLIVLIYVRLFGSQNIAFNPPETRNECIHVLYYICKHLNRYVRTHISPKVDDISAEEDSCTYKLLEILYAYYQVATETNLIKSSEMQSSLFNSLSLQSMEMGRSEVVNNLEPFTSTPKGGPFQSAKRHGLLFNMHEVTSTPKNLEESLEILKIGDDIENGTDYSINSSGSAQIEQAQSDPNIIASPESGTMNYSYYSSGRGKSVSLCSNESLDDYVALPNQSLTKYSIDYDGVNEQNATMVDPNTTLPSTIISHHANDLTLVIKDQLNSIRESNRAVMQDMADCIRSMRLMKKWQQDVDTKFQAFADRLAHLEGCAEQWRKKQHRHSYHQHQPQHQPTHSHQRRSSLSPVSVLHSVTSSCATAAHSCQCTCHQNQTNSDTLEIEYERLMNEKKECMLLAMDHFLKQLDDGEAHHSSTITEFIKQMYQMKSELLSQ